MLIIGKRCYPVIPRKHFGPIVFILSTLYRKCLTQAAVIAELSSLIAREGTPGGVIAGQTTAGGIILLSHIDDAIGISAGVTDWSLTAPTANVTNSTGTITTLGTVTFI